MVTATATANYNPATKSVQINVIYIFIGFLSPVDNPPTLNVGSAGRTYPVKWQLKDASGNYVSSLTSFASLRYTTVTCGVFTGYSPDVITEEAVATGGTVLRYDSNQFIYNWKTPSAPNVCYILILTLDDGTPHLADWQSLYYGSPSSSDTIGITLWNGSGGIWFSTNWVGSPRATVEQQLGGGNLEVH